MCTLKITVTEGCQSCQRLWYENTEAVQVYLEKTFSHCICAVKKGHAVGSEVRWALMKKVTFCINKRIKHVLYRS